MKTIKRGKRPKFVRMRLKPKLTKSTSKTMTIIPKLFENGQTTTTLPEMVRSRETKRVSSMETISPPSIIPVTITPSPPPSTVSPQNVPSTDFEPTFRLEIIHDSLNNVQSNELITFKSQKLAATESPKIFSLHEVFIDGMNEKVLSGDTKLENSDSELNRNLGEGDFKSVINGLEIEYLEDDQYDTSTTKNEYDILPALSVFGSLSSSEKNEGDDNESVIQKAETDLEADIEAFNKKPTEIFREDIINEESFTELNVDVETFKPIILDENRDASTPKTIDIETDVEIFDPNSESVLVSNKQSMLELQTAKATIEPPPASTDDDAVVHEHDLVILQTQAPSELLETSESSKFLTKGNPV